MEVVNPAVFKRNKPCLIVILILITLKKEDLKYNAGSILIR